MNIHHILKQNKDRWWALPLILPVVLLPVLSVANTLTQLGDGIVALYYLPLSFLLALMLFFGLEALPGVVVSLFLRYYPSVGLFETVAGILHFIVPLVLSWGGYRVFAPRRNMTAYGDIRLMGQRIFWQVFCPATLFLVLFQFAVYLGIYESRQSLAGLNPLNIRTPINYQGLLVSGLTGVPLSYLLIRLIRHPRYIKGLMSQLRAQIDKKVTAVEFVVWFLALGGLLVMLLLPMNANSSIFSTNYTLSLLMPVMLWGAMRFGYKLMSLIWTPVLLVSIHFFLSLHSGARGVWHSAGDHLIQLSGLFLRCDVHVDAGDTPARHQYSLPQSGFSRSGGAYAQPAGAVARAGQSSVVSALFTARARAGGTGTQLRRDAADPV